MEPKYLRGLYLHELKDLYSAEKQIMEVLPKMVKAAGNRQLAAALEVHVGQSTQHAEQLSALLTAEGESLSGPLCMGMEGVLREVEQRMQEEGVDEVRDARLIAAAQRIEHYEIAGYSCARIYALGLGDLKSARVLDAILSEEEEIAEKLGVLAMTMIGQGVLAPAPAVREGSPGLQAVGKTVRLLVKKVTG